MKYQKVGGIHFLTNRYAFLSFGLKADRPALFTDDQWFAISLLWRIPQCIGQALNLSAKITLILVAPVAQDYDALQ